MRILLRWTLAAVITVAALFTTSAGVIGAASAETPPPEEISGGSQVCEVDVNEALLIDAKSYANSHTVSHTEAQQRLCFVSVSHDIRRDAKALDPHRFAAAWIQHEPTFGLIVTYKGRTLPDGSHALVDRALLPITLRGGAQLSESEVDQARRDMRSAMKGHPTAFGGYYDFRTDQFVVHVEGPDSQLANARASLPDLPDMLGDVRVEMRAHRFVPQIAGGIPLWSWNEQLLEWRQACTAGFPVVSNADFDVKGFVTAAHCEEYAPLNYRIYEPDGSGRQFTFPIQGEPWEGPTRDVMWGTAREVEPRFHADRADTTRPVEGWVPRDQQFGDPVCHYGVATGYSCGTVESITYDRYCPSGVGTCSQTWVLVTGNDLECDGGDSGGPWFNVYNPYGVHSAGPLVGCGVAGAAREAVYMPINFISVMPVTLYQDI